MDENVTMTAIFVGAGLFVALVTISAIIMFYNKSTDVVSATSSETNYEVKYRKDIDVILEKKEISGTEAKNLIYFFCNNEDFILVMDNLTDINIVESKGKLDKINNKVLNNNDDYARILKLIMPEYKFSLKQTYDNKTNKTTLLFTKE